jgi:ribonuclease-3 family protein
LDNVDELNIKIKDLDTKDIKINDTLKKINLKETNGITLAYLGDSVWELFIRTFYIEKNLNIKNLNKKVKAMVNAKKQSEIFKKIFSSLDKEYQELGKRGKNGNIKSFPKSCTPYEYREATAFEAIIGSLYINNKIDFIKNIIKIYAEEEI